MSETVKKKTLNYKSKHIYKKYTKRQKYLPNLIYLLFDVSVKPNRRLGVSLSIVLTTYNLVFMSALRWDMMSSIL